MWLWVAEGRPTHKIPQIQFGIRGQRRGERLNISFVSTTHKHAHITNTPEIDPHHTATPL